MTAHYPPTEPVDSAEDPHAQRSSRVSDPASKDLEATRTFYHDTLGLEILREDEGDRIVFRCGGGTQLAVTLSTVGTTDTQTQLAWKVPDIHAALADLRTRGVRIEEYVAPAPVTTDGVADMGHSWAAWFTDPSGNVLAVVQPKG